LDEKPGQCPKKSLGQMLKGNFLGRSIAWYYRWLFVAR